VEILTRLCHRSLRGPHRCRRRRDRWPVLCALLVAFVLMAAVAEANDTNQLSKSSDALDNMTLEQLVNVQVTSVSKKETDLFASPAAIYVITQDDIRRMGVTSIPEALRMVPGMDVARISGNEWAVSTRGFNGEYASDLLVLIDGRTIYTPASSGVFWDSQDVVLEDVDRIEVIRGPGATLWGANAVNGVVNIITKSAKETQGGMVSTSLGTEDQPITTVRYGGELATNLYYRVYAKYSNHPALETSTGGNAADDSSALRGGFRMDYEPSTQNDFTWQGDYYTSDAGKQVNQITLVPAAVELMNVEEHNSGGNVLGRWTRTFSEDSQMTLQTYYDHVEQGDGFGEEIRNTFDVDLQHRFALGARNDIVWGAGYRHTDIKNTPSFNLIWIPESQGLQLGNAFVQDDITLVRDRLHFTLGSKVEYNNLIGFEIEPSARLLWTPTERQTVWAAVSRATRTPALFELDGRLNEAAFPSGPPPSPPILVSLLGNPNLKAENLTAYELGYRIEPAKRLSFDAAAFYNVYGNLITEVPNATGFEASPAPPHLLISSTWQNLDSGETYGTELSAQWQVLDHWRLMASYTFLHMQLGPDTSFPPESSSPQQQFQVRSYLDLPHNVEFNGAIYYIDEISTQSGGNVATIPSYTKLDLGLTWRPCKSLEIGIWGKDLLENEHPEFPSQETTQITEIPRSVMATITWRF
jgi:iron complex outermembrane recepter protein